MKRINSIVVVLLVCVACGHKQTTETTTEAEVPSVEVTTIRSLQPTLEVVLPGELKPWNKTNIYPKVKGYVSKLIADRGMVVNKGQVLATLEAPEHKRGYPLRRRLSLSENLSNGPASEPT
jgi:membrane fusion protein (multidrug efflux system)